MQQPIADRLWQEEQMDRIDEAMHQVFSTPEGKAVLAWILTQCGVFETDPQRIDRSLLAFANELMRTGCMGIYGHAGRYADALVMSYDPGIMDEII